MVSGGGSGTALTQAQLNQVAADHVANPRTAADKNECLRDHAKQSDHRGILDMSRQG